MNTKPDIISCPYKNLIETLQVLHKEQIINIITVSVLPPAAGVGNLHSPSETQRSKATH